MLLRAYEMDDCQTLDESGERYEIINGKVYMLAAPNREHQRVSGELFAILHRHTQKSKCAIYAAPFDVRLPMAGEDASEDAPKPRNVVQPDISVICDQSKLTKAGCTGAPDLIIEIMSPSSASFDYLLKKNLYEKAGVKEYWIADPEIKRVYIFRHNGSSYDDVITLLFDDTLHTPLFPELSINVGELFTE